MDDTAHLSDAERDALKDDESEVVQEALPEDAPVVEDAAPEGAPEPETEIIDSPDVPSAYVAPAVSDYEAQLESIKTRFEEGDISLDERDQLRESLLAQKLKAEISAEITQQAEARSWQEAQDAFFKDNSKYTTNPVMYSALNAAVIAIANDPQYQGRGNAWVLNEAHRQITEAFGGPAQKPAPAKPKAAAPALPVTLSQLPAASISETGEDEFAHIDAMIAQGKAMDMERALARMTQEQQARYLQGA
jgi:hypothetical protein